jgi:cholesterol transport system auxiliary component
MTSSTPRRSRQRVRDVAWTGLLGLSVLSGCGSLLPKLPAQPALFVIDDTTSAAVRTLAAPAVSAAAPTLVVNEPRAAPGYGTRQIVYVRTANELEYFAFNQWAEPPSVMLAPLLVHAIERTGAFRAVVRAPTSVAGDMRLDTELVRLQQDFTAAPSRVHLTLRAVLIDTATRRVVAWREFDADVASSSEDAPGGVAAANDVAHRVLVEVGAFCAEWIAKRN